MSKATFGNVRKRSSGRYQARYTGPDGVTYSAPNTFVKIGHAGDWLAEERLAISAGTWIAPPLRDVAPEVDPRDTLLFGDYAETWIAGRRTKRGEPLAPRSREAYTKILANILRPAFGDRTVRSITKLDVRQWHATACPDAPSYRAHAYSLLRAIMTTAVEDEVIDVNPCTIKGASSVKRKRPITVLRTDDYVLLVKSMPEKYRAMVMLATWTALRFGELAELRRADVDIEPDDSAGVVHVRRAVARTRGKVHRDRTKSEAGVRNVTIPPHLVPAIAEHLRDHVRPEATALLFPATHGDNLHATSLYRAAFYPARESIGRGDLRFHDLRHTGAVLAAQAGATVADLMARLGHSTPDAAILYQHTSAERDALVAAEMSRRMTGM